MMSSAYLLLLTLIAVGIYFVVTIPKKRAKKQELLENYRKVSERTELRESEKITKNGVHIIAEVDKERYSVKKCPYCTEEINKDATKCRHCGERVGKGYEIISDGTYVSNKIKVEQPSIHINTSEEKGNLFFRVVWITLTVLVVIFLFNAAILTAFFSAIFG